MRVLGEGRFLRLVERGGWELVERPGVESVVGVVAVTDDRELILVEQYREPVKARVIELPAGLVGDEGDELETLEAAAQRELIEEAGFRAREFELLTAGPPSAGQSSEIVSILRASGVVACGDGGGVGDEKIERHLVPLPRVAEWLQDRAREGRFVDPKIWLALYFLNRPAAAGSRD